MHSKKFTINFLPSFEWFRFRVPWIITLILDPMDDNFAPKVASKFDKLGLAGTESTKFRIMNHKYIEFDHKFMIRSPTVCHHVVIPYNFLQFVVVNNLLLETSHYSCAEAGEVYFGNHTNMARNIELEFTPSDLKQFTPSISEKNTKPKRKGIRLVFFPNMKFRDSKK